MASQLLSIFGVAAVSIVSSIFVFFHLRSYIMKATKQTDRLTAISSSPELTRLNRSLAAALPDSVISVQDKNGAFKQSMNSYWAQQECEVIPECVIRPRNVQQLSMAVKILKQEYDERTTRLGKQQTKGLFAVRGGGHSPIPGAASIEGGVVIDLSLFCEVTPSEDRSTVVIGAGVKWMDVSRVLDKQGLAVVGGRNSTVGVGGLTLGGGISFFSSRFGLVCSNILSYELVLASGQIATASASVNPDLWRALKGGTNNLGIVTRFTARSFPCTNIWSGFLYIPAFQAAKVLTAFHEFVNRANIDDPSTTYDENAAGPIVCFSYIQPLGFQVISVNLVYTKPLENKNRWPVCWRTSSFASLWRFWSTCKVRTVTDANDEMNELNPAGRRQVFAATTIKNDAATLIAAHATYHDAIVALRRVNVKGLVWTLVLQPLLPSWVVKGDPNMLGLNDWTDDPLVIVSFTVNWLEPQNDEFVNSTLRHTIEQIDAFAAAHKTGHRYRCLNYCAHWQKPFEGYGEENLRFLKEVSRRYDPDGLFQRGCVGGFKLGMMEGET